MRKKNVKEDHLFVRFLVAKGPHTAMTAEHYVKEPHAFASGMRNALPWKLIEEWGIKIEVRSRHHYTKADWKKPGRLVRSYTRFGF
jgi:hypothetical protein